MIFTDKEIAAIAALSKVMVGADGRVTKEEGLLAATGLANICSGRSAEAIVKMADEMEPSKAFEIVKNLTQEEKKYVSGFLAAISMVDGEVDAKELAVWHAISAIANFPKTSFVEAVEFWTSRN